MKRFIRGLIPWLLIIGLVFLVYRMLGGAEQAQVEIDYSKFIEQLEGDNIEKVEIRENHITGSLKHEARTDDAKPFTHFKTIAPIIDTELVNNLRIHNVKITTKDATSSWWTVMMTIGPSILIVIMLIAFWFMFMRQMQSTSSKAMSFSISRAKILTENRPNITFNDVASCDEAKVELQEIIEFLRDPKKFQRLGGRIPKGVLILGPPGTGKTLLAKAVAGEANVPFLSISGSDFVELFVGVGAARVRDLFEQGRRNAPCIIFIDEIDAVGRVRGAGLGGGHDEREQTLNQLLVEMDGFDTKEGVILIAATNRPDILDPALLRPGRFDRRIVVDLPDVKGREGILRVHIRNIPLADDVDLSIIARGTPYFSGADLANLVNEAALLAARKNKDRVNMEDFEEARDKVMMGPERKSKVMSEREKKLAAYHEVGHAIVAKTLPDMDPVHKVTIIPRGLAHGLTQFLPKDEKYTYNKSYCMNILSAMLGGRSAEEIIFGEVSSGAGSDLDRATELARRMVCEWGMSDKLGPIAFGKNDGPVFIGRELAMRRDYSEKTAQEIDSEIRRIIEEANERASKILLEKKNDLVKIAEILLERETLTGDELDMLFQGKDIDDLETLRQEHTPQIETETD
ncbi:MAG: ATP-dependent zinc metalloprotease FtsH [bacterium]